MEDTNKEALAELDAYAAHIETIKKLTIDTYGLALTEYCHNNILPTISRGLMLLHFYNPGKKLPDLEMVLFCLVKEASTVSELSKIGAHVSESEVLFAILDEALELTEQAGFN